MTTIKDACAIVSLKHALTLICVSTSALFAYAAVGRSMSGESMRLRQTAQFHKSIVHDAASPDVLASSPSCQVMRSRSMTGPASAQVIQEMTAELTRYRATIDNCPMFMTNYQASDPYVYWTPWQPDDTIGKWSRHLDCQSDEFCDAMYPLEENRQIAKHLYDHQHPVDCANAKFLVITKEWIGGIGSAIHVKSFVLLSALKGARVLIDAADENRWRFTHPALCDRGSMECFFAPLTHCQLPPNWKGTARPLVSLDDDAQYLFTNSSPAAAGIAGGTGLHHLGFDHKPPSWWVTHASAYIVRPNLQTLQATCFAWNCIMHGAAQPVRPFASVFVRAGDKHKEANPTDPHEYFSALWSLSHNLTEPVRTVYVGTDSALLLNRVIQDYRDDWNMVWTGYFRSAIGTEEPKEISMAFTAELGLMSLITLVDVYISSAADVLVGTLTSNQCRLRDELRKVQGKARMPYVTPERQLLAGV
jgi:hypothetical protein